MPITQNAMDANFSIRQFPSTEHPYIVFPQKNLAVLDISRLTFCKVDYIGHSYVYPTDQMAVAPGWSCIECRSVF